jgi:predicted MPP superfamily phosphohydrolase
VVASDFHAGVMTHPQVIADVCAAMGALEPDLVCLGGDYVSWDYHFIAELMPSLASVRAPFGHLAIVGNHDLWADDVPIRRALTRYGYRILLNEEIRLAAPYDRVAIYGMDDPTAGAPQAPPPLTRDAVCRLVLMHSPEGLAYLPVDAFHLVFAGHTHGGQIALRNGSISTLRRHAIQKHLPILTPRCAMTPIMGRHISIVD